MGKECKGGEIQPMSQEQRQGGGKQGRATVTCSPDSGGMHSLIGAIDTALPLRYFSDSFDCPLSAFLDCITLP